MSRDVRAHYQRQRPLRSDWEEVVNYVFLIEAVTLHLTDSLSEPVGMEAAAESDAKGVFCLLQDAFAHTFVS